MTSSLPSVVINPHWLGFRCVLCDRSYGPDWRGFTCGECGPEGILDAQYDYGAIAITLDPATLFPPAAQNDLWRFAPLLPMSPTKSHPAWSLGNSPLQQAPRLSSMLGLRKLFLKDDTGLPSASLKDRATAMALADAVRSGKEHLACASTGNAAASLATLTARAGFACTIFVPASAPQAKLAQLLLHGANVIRIDGSYDTAYEITLRLLNEHGWYSRNCAHNPLLVEGKKSAGLEIAAALNWQPPAAVFVPVGDGCIVTSVAKAFIELRELGLCTDLPRVYGVQAAGAAPIARAWDHAGDRAGRYRGRDILAAVSPLEPSSCADSIAVGVPRNRVKAWQYVAKTGGGFLTVPDEEILAAVRLLAREAGLFAEPSAAAALAGINRAKASGLIDPDDPIVAMVTGHGLKDPGPALSSLDLPEPVSPQGPFPF